MSDFNLQQRINVTFCVKSGNSSGQTCAIFAEVSGREAVKKSGIFKRHKIFKTSGQRLENTEKIGSPKKKAKFRRTHCKKKGRNFYDQKEI
jgi:hypothetical protein